ncbi:unnamed protein product [Absidia cylindrospora]
MFGSCFSSRKFAKTFSVVVWINCTLSMLKYVTCLALMISHRYDITRSCLRSGFSNYQTSITPAIIPNNPYYSPIRYPGTLNANATSQEDCEASIKSFLITFGVVCFIIQVLQFYFATVVSAYASRLRNGARHHRLHDQQIKDFEESRYHMSTISTVY